MIMMTVHQEFTACKKSLTRNTFCLCQHHIVNPVSRDLFKWQLIVIVNVNVMARERTWVVEWLPQMVTLDTLSKNTPACTKEPESLRTCIIFLGAAPQYQHMLSLCMRSGQTDIILPPRHRNVGFAQICTHIGRLCHLEGKLALGAILIQSREGVEVLLGDAGRVHGTDERVGIARVPHNQHFDILVGHFVKRPALQR